MNFHRSVSEPMSSGVSALRDCPIKGKVSHGGLLELWATYEGLKGIMN